MLEEMSSREVTQWMIYFKIKDQQSKESAEAERLQHQAKQNRLEIEQERMAAMQRRREAQ